MTAWTVRDRDGRLIADLTASSPVEVGRRIVPARYDAFRLAVSSSYRAMFDRAVAQVLEREGWQIVRVKASSSRRCAADRGVCAAAA
jgi:hypothetical protein